MRKSTILKFIAQAAADRTRRGTGASGGLPPGAEQSGAPGRIPRPSVAPGLRRAQHATARAAVSSGFLAAGTRAR